MSNHFNKEIDNYDGLEVTDIESEVIKLEEDEYEEGEYDASFLSQLRPSVLFSGVSGKFMAAVLAISSLLTCYFIYYGSTTYMPKERELLEDNIFSGNSLVISQEEVDDICDIFEEKFGIEIEEEYQDEYCILDAILKNRHLTEKEKKFFYGYIDLIKDNPYLDKEAAYKGLLNVDISHKRRPHYIESDTQGIYTRSLGSIGIFVDDEEKKVQSHEGVHCVFSSEKLDRLPGYFYEGVTELLSNEYFSDNPYLEIANYPFNVAAVRMLCEVTSPDTVLKAFSYGDMNIIAEEIAKITGNIAGANAALNNLDYAMSNWKEKTEDGKPLLDRTETLDGFIPLFRACIVMKYEEDEIPRQNYFYNEILFANIFEDDFATSYIDDLVEFGTFRRAYFSSKLKQQLALENSNNDVTNKSDDVSNKSDDVTNKRIVILKTK